ncbi:OPT family oligopeptide transporter [Tuwongella immobilis]|uniref:Oligopeptide transporter, OPT family n=1 Tax=Tuwongella immobilis TaxID=692036 RepID=A0A6C2YQG7_9BACT|nr:oligopeptide transporter, OPT family [Tuwongella immobilis]VIP03597.1 peptide transporter : Putative oligopeptide transporter, OPT family OS=Singulisphaera acidiphila (strain ATCC BAA-1392 / DSM 18658 / VKM B-2454 / MOB10) GN=Sinac_1500 PE=4 SV=1: OPT: OPT [Tuwongella immobilis]VTS04562.1 peptide transporter : Putative oligopeptide transporter, OPT family OS=Singulisphaera acidiphila (strain ATCC BAA-1392 / DSM 18658 / VKM B-2454 / MOB10) GN=Sinac_1500 PE=4 SV=1: OPT: OPT [Tuwongella immobilis
MATNSPSELPNTPESTFQPYVRPETVIPEFTWGPIAMGALLGIIFGASSLYLVLKVGLTVSASIPVAVLSLTLFRVLSKVFGFRPTTILENNIVQTTGSAGESIAFGVGLTMPTLLLLGFDIDVVRVMTVGVLGGLLGILMMIPLRRAFVVKQHGVLKYPEGTACADVLIAGEKGGSMAKNISIGFGMGMLFHIAQSALKLFKGEAAFKLFGTNAAGKTVGLKGGVVGSDLSAVLLGVGYIIGPRIASIMVAGGVLAYLVIVPLILYIGSDLTTPVPPEKQMLIRDMEPDKVRNAYILYIGAGAVATGGIISMFQALPVILSSVISGFRDLRADRKNPNRGTSLTLRTEHDLPMSVVLFGSIGMVVALAAAPSLGLGFSLTGIAGALMILAFGFLFVTVSSRLTGEIGSSSNPISGMTVATLLLTCLLFLGLDGLGLVTINKEIKLAALTIASVVCIASSNGGTTSQALKTGHLIGATPRNQQLAILIGSLTSAAVIGLTLLLLNTSGTSYTKKDLPNAIIPIETLTVKDKVHTGMYASDTTEYHVLNVGNNEKDALVPPGRYLVDHQGAITYRVDPAINGTMKVEDNDEALENKFVAPKTQLMALIINGVLDQDLPWDLVMIGALIAFTLELAGVPALPFAVGIYLPLSASTPIFIGGMIRWLVDRVRKPSSAESDSSPGVLLSSGFIAGGSIASLLYAFANFSNPLTEFLDISEYLPKQWNESELPGLVAFAFLGITLLIVGLQRSRSTKSEVGTNSN